ncbi:MAG TPA: VTT domain-containing protein [Candidatus Paceibacterota bacterium]|nr:VTT domain-containing protein [Candidatus Paceibacterota bacterium]
MLHFLLASIEFDPMTILRVGGYVGLAFLIFAESGLLIGIFFPGDSLLFAAGLIAASGLFSLWLLIGISILAAVVGDSVGYWIGAQAGSTLFKRENSRFFKPEYVERTEYFYARYGGRAVLLSRFVPIVRTIAPTLAGVSSMTYRTFITYNILGGILWGGGMIVLGFFLGSAIPNSGKYILPISLVIIGVSFLPIIIDLIRRRRIH